MLLCNLYSITKYQLINNFNYFGIKIRAYQSKYRLANFIVYSKPKLKFNGLYNYILINLNFF